MPFEPGHSGNPGGRPKGLTQVRELARTHTEAAIAALAKIMQKEDAADQAVITAAVALLDRAWGRPTQPIAGDDEMPSISIDRYENAFNLISAALDKISGRLASDASSDALKDRSGDRRFGAKPRKNFVDDQAASPSSWKTLAWRFGWQRSGDRSVLGCAVRASGGVAEPQRARV